MKWSDVRTDLIKDQAVADELIKSEGEYRLVNEYIGSTFDSFLEEEGIKEKVDHKEAEDETEALLSTQANKKHL
jgi:hypothetical protein